MNIQNARLITIRDIVDSRGHLSFIEIGKDLPFQVSRAFWVYGVPRETTRAGHAHRRNEQVHVCVSGSVTFALDDGANQEEITLDSPTQVLYTGPMVWHDIGKWEKGSVLFVLNSIKYDEEEYVRDHREFLELTR